MPWQHSTQSVAAYAAYGGSAVMCITVACTVCASQALTAGTADTDGAPSVNSRDIDCSPGPDHGSQRGKQSTSSGPQRLAVPKKSAKKWRQLRSKRVADAQLRAVTAAGFNPAATDLSRPADAAAASAALAIRAWSQLRAVCGWQPSVIPTEHAAASGGDNRGLHNVASLSDKQETALAGMFRAAYKTCEARVDPELIAEAVQPYTLDKFESRADLCCRALLEARARFLAPERAALPCRAPVALFPERSQMTKAADKRSEVAAQQLIRELTERKRAAAIEGDFVAANELKAQLDNAVQTAAAARVDKATGTTDSLPPIRIASLGGGPGNDALGCLLFAALCDTSASKATAAGAGEGTQPIFHRQLKVTVYDFCRGWEDVVNQVSAALPAVMSGIIDELALGSSRPPPPPWHSLEFAVCDLQLPPSSATNAEVMRGASEVDLIVCSFCCHESGAATKRPLSENLLRRLLQEMKYGSALLVIDLWEKSITEVANLIKEIGKDSCQQSSGSFVLMRLGSSRDFPFKGLFAVKAPDKLSRDNENFAL